MLPELDAVHPLGEPQPHEASEPFARHDRSAGPCLPACFVRHIVHCNKRGDSTVSGRKRNAP